MEVTERPFPVDFVSDNVSPILAEPLTSKPSPLDKFRVNFFSITEASVTVTELFICVVPSIVTLPLTSKATALDFSRVSFSFILVVPSISVLPVDELTTKVLLAPSVILRLLLI